MNANPTKEEMSNFKGSLNKESFKTVRNLHINWYIHSVKALMGQLGKQLYKKLDKGGKKRFLRCLDDIEDERELVYGARCLSKARKLIKSNNIQTINDDVAFLQEAATNIEAAVSQSKTTEQEDTTANVPPTDSFPKIYRGSVGGSRKSLANVLKIKPQDAKPKAKNNTIRVLKSFLNSLTVSKPYNSRLADIQNKRLKHWQNYRNGTVRLNLSDLFITTPKNNAKAYVEYGKGSTFTYRSKRNSRNNKMQIITMDKLDSLQNSKSERTPLQKMTQLILAMTNGNEEKTDWANVYAKLLRFKKSMEDRRNLPGAKIYDHRLYDIVTDRKKPSKSTKDTKPFPDFYTMTYKLVDALKGTKSGPEVTTIKLLSPRLAPLMPDKISSKRRVLSPSFFSFYKEDSPDNIASIPNILDRFGLHNEDKNAVMNLLMSFSGASKAINKTLETLRQINFFGLENEFFEVTKTLNALFKRVENSFDTEQKDDINTKGYTFLEKEQIEELIRGHNISDPEDIGYDLKVYSSLNKQQKYDALWDRIEHIAQNNTNMRTKRQVLSPVVLAPYMFAPVFGISVLGPVVLSPSLFSPLILSPACLSPYVLSPGVGMPFILSPYVLSPYVLSPIVMAPFVLSPYVLSPNVLNPYLLSPIILSPYVLSPDVLSPAALGGPILSPSAFSPAVLTDTVIMADVLSPSFMS